MPTNVPERLGPYEILSLIGAGGMGEVYRAKDTRLDRTVAIKILSSSFAADPERLRRFEQEARTLAALNHPNILAVHDIGTENGSPYLVSEFLEGETLRDLLARGPMSTRRATDYALGVAQGLAAGHSKGIVHRDVKPENIFLTRDGRVKILDFGLARLAPATDSGGAETVMGTSLGTTPGMVLGTVGYMSPEQVRGEPAEATSDIFSLGVVLYEMLSGKRAFKRDTAAETMTAILREEPPELTDSGWHGPPGLQRILERCLEKQPQRRFQSASDLAFALESLSESATSRSSAGGIKLLPVRRNPIWIWPIAAIVLLALAGVGWFVGNRMATHPQPTFNQITFQRGLIPAARFTHDGQTVLYGGQFDNNPFQMFSVRPALLQPVPVAVSSALLYAVSSSDQMAVGSDVNGAIVYLPHVLLATLSEVPVSGGTPRPIAERVYAADYGPDGTLAVSRAGQGWCVVEFPPGKQVYKTSGYADHLRVSPDGRHIAFDDHPVNGDDRGWISVVNRDGKLTKMTQEFSAAQGLAWKSNNEIWFTATVNSEAPHLMAVNMSGAQRELLRAPVSLRLQDIAADGRVLLSTEEETNTISAVDPTGKQTPHFEVYNGSIPFDISHDGSAVLIEEFGAGSDTLYQVIYRKTDGSAPVILGKGASPEFSADNKSISANLLTSPPEVTIYPVGIGQTRTIPLPGLGTSRYSGIFPDNKHMLIGGAPPSGPFHAYMVNIDEGSFHLWGPDNFIPMTFSPDGKRVAGKLNGQGVIYSMETKQTTPLPPLGPKENIQVWTADGSALLLNEHDTSSAWVTRLDLATGKRTVLKKVESPDKAGDIESNLLTSDDGKAYAFWQAADHSTLWVVDGVK